MDDPVPILRMAERIIAVLLGGMSIYLGYRLFFHLPLRQDSDGELELPGIKIVLSRAGPGLFFAIFGSAVLYYSFTNPVKIETSTGPPALAGQAAADGQAETKASFLGIRPAPSPLSPQRRSKVLVDIEALNCAQRVLDREPSSTGLRDSFRIALRAAKRALLLSVWDRDAWGSAEAFDKSIGAESPNARLDAALNTAHGDCPS